MAEVTREVLIKLKIQQLPFRMRTPDISGAQRAASQIESVYKTAYANVRTAANAATNNRLPGIDISAFTASATQASSVMQAELTKIESQVDVINSKLTQMGTGLTQVQGAAVGQQAGTTAADPAPAKAEKTAAEIERAYRNAFQRIGADYRQMQIDMGKTGVNTAQLQALNARLASQRAVTAPVTQGLIQAGEGYRRAAEGAFHLARGIALLNYDSEAELAILLKKLAYYQGLFDIVRGGQDIVTGMVTGTRSLINTYAGLAAAAATSGGSITVMSVAMNYATASATAMWTAVTGPIGLAIMGTAAVAAVATVAWYKYGNAGKEAADKATEALKKQAEAARLARYDLEKLTQAAQRQKNFEGRTSARDAVLGVRQGQQNTYIPANVDAGIRAQEKQITEGGLADIQAKLANNQAAAAKQRAAFITTAAQQADFKNSDNFIGQSAGVSVQGFSSFNPKQFKPGYAESLGSNQAEFSKLQERLQKLASAKPEKFSGDVKTEESRLRIMERQAELQKTMKTQTEAQNRSEQARLTLLGEQRTAIEQIVTTEKARYAASKLALLEEENKRKTAVQRFGELRPDQQQQLQQLGQQVKTNGIESLNEGQIQQLRDSSFGQSILSKLDYKKGTAAGADDFLKNIGEFKPGNTTNLEEGQGADETKADYLKRMQQDIKSEIAKREAEMAQIVQQSRESSGTVIKLLEQLANDQPLIDVLQTALTKKQAQIDNLKAELERVKSSADKAADATRRGQMSRGGY